MKFTGNSRIVCRETFADGKLNYCLIESDVENTEGRTVTYGISIECSLFGMTEREELRDITTDIDLAKELFDKVHLYMVLPVHLREVAEDFIQENP